MLERRRFKREVSFLDRLASFARDAHEKASLQQEALAALGDAAKDYVRHHPHGRLTIRVRDNEGAILEVSAALETKLIRR